MNVDIYPYSIEHSYIKEYKKLFRYNIICFMCYGNILPINNQNDNDDYCIPGRHCPPGLIFP